MQESTDEPKGVQKDETKVDNAKVEKVEEEVNDLDVIVEDEGIIPTNISTDKEKSTSSFALSTTVASEAENTSFAVIRDTAQSMDAMEIIANKLVSSKLCPIKNASDVIVAILTGNQYGFHFMVSVNNIFPINGKPTMSVHLQRALLIKHRIIFKKIYDYEPIYEFGKLNEDKSNFDFMEVANAAGQKMKVPKNKVTGYLADKPITHGIIREVDRITKYSFSRLIKLEDGSYDKLEVTAEYKMTDASTAGLLDKENWKNHPPRMLDARAFSIGAKEIASDILLGVYSINELADEHNIKYTIDNSGQETIVPTDN